MVVSSKPTKCTTHVRLNVDNNIEEEEAERPESCVYPELDIFQLQVICSTASIPELANQTPATYQTVPNTM